MRYVLLLLAALLCLGAKCGTGHNGNTPTEVRPGPGPSRPTTPGPAVPEPGGVLIFGLGAAMVAAHLRRRR